METEEHGSIESIVPMEEYYTATPLPDTTIEENQSIKQSVCVEEAAVHTTLNSKTVQVTCDMGTQTEECVSEKFERTLPCGHPCMQCVQDNVSKAIESDHSYFQTPARKAPTSDFTVFRTQDILYDQESTKPPVPTHSTPRKSLHIPQKSNFCDTIQEEDELNESSISFPFRDDSHDYTFVCDSDAEESEAESECAEVVSKSVVDENKFLVFESCLDELFTRLKCSELNCNSIIDLDDIKKDITNGTNLRTQVYCSGGHLVLKWSSQPLLGRMAAGNLLVSAAILFSGLGHGRLEQFANYLNLKFPSHTTFNTIQREHLMPVVLNSWQVLQHKLLQEVRDSGRPLRLAGDERCDSPGYSAKYCTYSLLDLETDAIVSFVVFNVNETGSSTKMELEGFRRCMLYLLDQGCRVELVATDRHVQIRSAIKKEFSETKHQFDVWHLAKCIKKKLALKAKSKGMESLQEWSKSITNHLWWCAANCKGDPDWLEECWVSVVNYVANIHSFSGSMITSCPHADIPVEITKRKKWLKPGSKPHNALKEVVLDKRLRKDIRQLSEFCHTGSLESYHSLMTKYVPKRQEFDHDQMETRTALAAIDHNMSRDRNQKVNKAGEKMFKIVCPKATVQWVAKPIYEDKNYDQKEKKLLPAVKLSQKSNIAPLSAPDKHELIKNTKSRFIHSV